MLIIKQKLKNYFSGISLTKRLVFMMLAMNIFLVIIMLLLYARAERRYLQELENQARELTKGFQIGVEEITASGTTDETRLSKYLKDVKSKGLKEISIISNAKEIVASTNPSNIGQAITHRKKELIIKAELGEPVSKEGKSYNVIVPVIADNVQYGYVHLTVNKDDFSDVIRQNNIERISATVLVFSIGIIIAVIFSRRYTRPINKLVDAVLRVSAGDLHQHIPVEGRDEIGLLAESFNLMVKKLGEARLLEERLRETEHLSALGQLSRSVAHEIRNPLNFINLSIDYIKDKYTVGDSEKQKAFEGLIYGIKQEVHRLDKLVNDFLEYGRPIKLRKQTVNVEQLIDDVMALVWAKAEADGIEIIKRYDTQAALELDADLFKSCVLNVISNAIQAMEAVGQGGESQQDATRDTGINRSANNRVDSQRDNLMLKVVTSIEGERFVLSITDSGVGIDPDDYERVFEPFFTKKQNGLGLGMPLTKRVMEEHGGSVELKSAEGLTEVRLILPIPPASSRGATPASSRGATPASSRGATPASRSADGADSRN
jgi:nitrogen fixation/metabolism regulation signal transduction histidine kinase